MKAKKPLLTTLLALTAVLGPFKSAASHASEESPYVQGQLLVRFARPTQPGRARSLLDPKLFAVDRVLVPSLDLYLIRLKEGITVPEAREKLARNGSVLYTQPDHRLALREIIPNDADFRTQWSLSNPSGADIRAPRAWDFGRGGKNPEGQELVVAVVDGGMDLAHKDLIENLWTNLGEIPGNGIDDDANGYIDDVHGWNAFSSTGDIPSASHGTHVAGIIGAKGNNGSQVSGVNWDVKLLAVAAASGTTSIVAAGYGYVIAQKQLWLASKGARGANIVATNSSFGVDYGRCDTGEFPVWNDLYNSMGRLGILSAAATANLNIDIDVQGDVPTGCSSEYLVTVTNTTRDDRKYSQAGFGRIGVDLGAPGTEINSTVPNNLLGYKTGTSMATPHVAGAIAFLHSVASRRFSSLVQADPAAAALEIKRQLLANVDRVSDLANRTASGGRLNLGKAAAAVAAY